MARADLIDLPEKQGLYDPRNEHDSCGVGFVADIKGRKSHQVLRQAIEERHGWPCSVPEYGESIAL